MKPSLLVLVLAALSSSALAQYGYTPPVPPTPPTPPAAPPPSYPSYGAPPPAGAGMDVGYSSPSYSSPTYTGYASQPASGGYSMGGGDILGYGFLEGFYQLTDFDRESFDAAHGLGVALSAPLFNPLYLKGGFNWGTSNGGSEEDEGFDFNSVSLGIGVHLPIIPRLHLVCDVGGAYYDVDADSDSLSFSEGAIYVHPALRLAVAQRFELQAGLLFSSADDYDAMLIDVGAFWNMFASLDLKVGADFGDESTAWKAGLRVRW